MPTSAPRIEAISVTIESFGVALRVDLGALGFEGTSEACRTGASHFDEQSWLQPTNAQMRRREMPRAESRTTPAIVPPALATVEPWQFHCAPEHLNNQEIASGNLRRVR